MMDASTEFVVTLSVGVLLLGGQVVVGLIAYAARKTVEAQDYNFKAALSALRSDLANFQSEQARINECLRHIEHDTVADARNLEDWKLKYAEAHGPLVSRVSSIETGIGARMENMSVNLQTVLIQVPLLTQKLDELARRLENLERAIKDNARERYSTA